MAEWIINKDIHNKGDVTKIEVTKRFITLIQNNVDVVALEQEEIKVLKEAILEFEKLSDN